MLSGLVCAKLGAAAVTSAKDVRWDTRVIQKDLENLAY